MKTFLLMLRYGDKWAFYVQHFRTTPTLCTVAEHYGVRELLERLNFAVWPMVDNF